MNFIKDFIARGYLYQCTNLEQLTKLFEEQKITAYIGFDCTAKSLHIGNLMQIMILRLLQQYGHKPIILIGGATTKISDPSGRTELRKTLTQQEIDENIAGIKYSLSKYITFGDGANDAVILNNAEWLDNVGYIEFLNECGRFISVNYMLTLDSIKTRLTREQSLTFLEFNYCLLQAYDFYRLNKKYNCVLQIGGSDQWGNIIMGVDLCHKVAKTNVYALTTALLTNSAGQKMGKSINGAVWLNEDMLSPYEFYQYWRNCDDADIVKFAKLYAEFDEVKFKEFNEIIICDINLAKAELAHRITALCHGIDAAAKARITSIEVFENRGVDENMPVIEIDHSQIKEGLLLCKLLSMCTAVKSNTEGRNLIRGGGVKINDIKIDDENLIISDKTLKNNDIFKNSEFEKNGIFKLSVGKKIHVKVIISMVVLSK